MKDSKPIPAEYLYWRNRVEGQIRHAINEHPEWFNLPTQKDRDRCVRSVAKRIIGEIVAGSTTGNSQGSDANGCVSALSECGASTRASFGTVGGTCAADRPFIPTNNKDAKE